MVYNFRKIFFIGQNLKHVHITYFFLNFWSCFVWSLFLTIPKKYYMRIQTSRETNHEIPIMNLFLILMLKKPVFKCKIKTPFFSFFFYLFFFFFHEHSRFTGQQGKGEDIYLTPLYHFYPLHRHLDISRAVTAESSPLHIASSRTRTRNLRF